MSNAVNDWAALSYLPAIAAPTAALATSVTGTGVDCLSLDGNMGALQVVGTVASTSFTYAGKIQESDTATGTYSDIAGATFAAIGSTTGAQITGATSFQRTKRFLRYVGTIGGTTPTAAVDALFLGKPKQG